MKVAKNVITGLYVSVVVWLIIASLQILFGLPLLIIGYGISMIGCGAWNIYASITRIKAIDTYKAHPELIYPYFESDLDHILIFLGINLLLGGVIGVIASIYDLILRLYVVSHKEELLAIRSSGDIYGQL